MRKLFDQARSVLPWAAVVGAAIVFGLSSGGGCAGVREEHRPMPGLSARVLGTDAAVSAPGLLGKPAIINIWSPG